MDTGELALVFFSILAQLAVGSFLVLGLVTWLSGRKAGREQAVRLAGWGWQAILAVMVLALLVSLTHLGNPKNAVLSVMRWQSAWLSREILCSLLFTAFLAAFVFMRWKKVGSDAQQRICAILAGVFGVVLVCSMSMIYTSIRTQPSWSTPFTAFSFFNTVLLLGALGAGAIVAGNHFSSEAAEADEKEPQRTLARQALRGLSLGAIVLVCIELVALPIYLLHLAGDPAGAMTARAIASEMRGVMVLRLTLAVAGAGVLAAIAYGFLAESRRAILAGKLVHVALALVLVAELLGRFIFYVSKVRIGV